KTQKLPPHGLENIGGQGTPKPSGLPPGQPNAAKKIIPNPPEPPPPQPHRISDGKKRGDTRAHRVAHHVDARELEMIEQGSHILRHARAVIVCWIIELARGTVSSIVERDDAPAGLYQRRNPAGIDPIHMGRGCKTVHENDRLALPLIKKCDF